MKDRDEKGTSRAIVDSVIRPKNKPTLILDDSRPGDGDPRTLANRAQAFDESPLGAVPDAALLEPAEFTHLDRANLIRCAKAIEQLNQVFKTTAKIEITNEALLVLPNLTRAIHDLRKDVAELTLAVSRLKNTLRDRDEATEGGALVKREE